MGGVELKCLPLQKFMTYCFSLNRLLLVFRGLNPFTYY